MPEPRIAAEAFGARLVQLLQRANQAHVDAEMSRGRSGQIKVMLDAKPRPARLAVVLENEAQL